MPYYIHHICGELNDNDIQRANQFAIPELKVQFSKIEEVFQKEFLF